MGLQVINGAVCTCSFGTAPSSLVVLPTNCVNASDQPAATINDNVAFTNVMPFTMCTSMSNPSVSSATSAAMGVLTPMPCSPVISAPWSAGVSTVTINNNSALDNASTLSCSYGGVISFTYAGQTAVTN